MRWWPRWQRLAREGVTIAIIEHTMQSMVRLVDRFVVLDHGAVLADGHPADVTRRQRHLVHWDALLLCGDGRRARTGQRDRVQYLALGRAARRHRRPVRHQSDLLRLSERR